MKTSKNYLLFFAVIFLFLLSSVKAQDLNGSLDCLKNEHLVNVVIDFSKGSFDGMDEKTWDGYGKESWELAKKQATMKFLQTANEYLKEAKVRIGNYNGEEAKYKFIVVITEVDDDGDTDAIVFLRTNDEENKFIAQIDDFESSGGKYGSFFNLMGDGFENLGKKFGKYLENELFWMH